MFICGLPLKGKNGMRFAYCFYFIQLVLFGYISKQLCLSTEILVERRTKSWLVVHGTAELGARPQNVVSSRACASFSNGVVYRAIEYFSTKNIRVISLSRHRVSRQ